ncbi:MAG: sensor histidine kinase [Chitinophagaceae bacterium]
MQLIPKAIFKHSFLVIIAAWLFTISFIVSNYWLYNATPLKVKNRIEKKIAVTEKAIEQNIQDTALLQSLISDSSSLSKTELFKKKYGFYVYVLNDVGSPILTFWNNNLYSISTTELMYKDGCYSTIHQNGHFELIKKTCTVQNKKVIIIATIPILWDYFIQNKYLQKDFDGYADLDEQYEITDDAQGLPVLNSKGEKLFHIKEKDGHNYAQYDVFTILLRLSSIILLILFLNRTSVEIVNNISAVKGFLFLFISVCSIRFITYHVSFPFDFSRLSLFDASIYASNFLHPSLGDLFVNSILLFWLVGFFKFTVFAAPHIHQFEARIQKNKSIQFINLTLLVLIGFAFANTAASLVTDSKISFDVSKFFSLNVYSVISLIILTFFALTFFHLSHILLKPLVINHTPLYQQLLAITISGLAYISIRFNDINVGVHLLVMLWCVLYVIIANYRKQDFDLSILKSTFFIFWIIFFALSFTSLVTYENASVEWAQRKKIAERLVLQNDPNGENILSIALSNVDNKLLVKNYDRLQFEFANHFIKDSIINENFSGYLNRFETSIYTYNHLLQPIFNDDSTTFYQLNSFTENRSTLNNITGLYAYETSNNELHYIYKKPIVDGTNTLGYLFIVAKPTAYKSEALYPSLFSQTQETNGGEYSSYAYAVYVNNKLHHKQNEYTFPLVVDKRMVSAFDFVLKKNGNVSELWYNGGSNKTVVIVKEVRTSIEVVTLFAYLFFTILMVVLFFHASSFLLRTKFSKQSFLSVFKLSIRSQIHTTIIFVSIFSFLIIGAATITFFVDRFNKNNQERLSKTIDAVAVEIGNKLTQVQTQLIFDDVATINDVGFGSNFEKRIAEVAAIYNSDINFYSANGSLLATTQRHIYTKQLLNNKMNANAFYELNANRISKFIQQEYIGKLKYLSIYAPVVDDLGNVYGYLNIPYLNSQLELNNEISSFIATIINLNAFVFLLAGAIAFLLTERIVDLFGVITEKMRDVNIGRHNEEIAWYRNDEILALVTEYNKMVRKLEVSAQALARSEREVAWREMARQVAHEIKNPLTPMKLSIQYLQKAIDNNAPNTKELSQKVARTLIEQIDQLAKIAGDFSQFANIGNPLLEKVNVTDILSNIVYLHQHQNVVEINHFIEEGNYVTIADKTQLSRLFTNLVKNAIEAVDEVTICKIDIHQTNKNNGIVITISDNGKGIPLDVIDRIFTPNFTTKTSGTGLGLAICKGIVEKMKGTIQFTTAAENGTTFEIWLPIINQE